MSSQCADMAFDWILGADIELARQLGLARERPRLD